MNKKLFQSILLIFTFLLNTSLISANNFDEEGWHFAAIATGKTTGHIGDLIISNKTEKANTIWLGSYIIPPENGKQGYAILKEEIEQIEVKSGDSFVHQLNGYCINVELPAPTEEETLPHFLKWLSAKNFDTVFVEQWNQTDEKPERLNFNTQLEQAAPIILEAVRQLEDLYFTWKSPLQIPDIYPGNTAALKEGVIQQAIWQFAEALQGNAYSFNQFEESIVKQEAIIDWLYSNGQEKLMIEDIRLNNKTYFNYQCQRLWFMINELNFYVNPASRKLMPPWKMNTGELETKNIEFNEQWENVALTGDYFKAEKSSKLVTPIVNNKTSEKKKIWPFIAGGVGGAGVVTGVILLTRPEGCTDPSACNYDEEAKKDDGKCEYGMTNCADPCNPTRGCSDATACNFNPNACIEDGSCEYDYPNCADPCNPVVGCTYSNACNYNAMACVEDGSCYYGNFACADPCNSILGCMDPMACNYEEEANCDDGNCKPVLTCNTDCKLGDLEKWDKDNCMCVVQITSVLGCIDETACNYNNTANCDDGSCIPILTCNTNCKLGDIEVWDQNNCRCVVQTTSVLGCIDETACNYDNTANCDDGGCIPILTCNTDCKLGDIEVWDQNNCRCIVQTPTVFGCTDATACNYNTTANCDDGSCKSVLTCNTDCKFGDIEVWDQNNCRCVVQTTSLLGCTDATACNYDTAANCDDGSCKPVLTCNTDCKLGDIEVWDQNNCRCVVQTPSVLGCTDATACNFNNVANCDDGSCSNILLGSSCDDSDPNTYDDVYNTNCICEGRLPNCNLNEGVVRFCENNSFFLFEANGVIYHPKLDLIVEEFNCFNWDIKTYEGQIVKFDYYKVEEPSSCNTNAQRIMLTCLQVEEKSNCNYQLGTIEYVGCVDNTGFNTWYTLITLDNGIVINPKNYGCSFFYNPYPVFANGTRFRLDFEKGNFSYPCDTTKGGVSVEGVVFTCIEEVVVAKTNQPQSNKYPNQLTPFTENRLITTSIKNSEFPETTVITNILGINYYQPITPTIFIENQTALGYIPASDLHFLNNKITLNAKNKYLPIHYGLGFNSNQLTDNLSLTDWQNDLIWNLGIKLPIFKKWQLEAEVFKSFNLEDAPNCSIRLIYQQTKSDKPLEKKKF